MVTHQKTFQSSAFPLEVRFFVCDIPLQGAHIYLACELVELFELAASHTQVTFVMASFLLIPIQTTTSPHRSNRGLPLG